MARRRSRPQFSHTTTTLVLVLVLATQLYGSWVGDVVEGKKPPIDYDALEKAWEAGDTREELQSTGDQQFEALASKSEEEAKALGPQMVFVTLRSDRGDRSESLADIASRWKELLWNGGLEVTVYEIEADKKLLVGLQRGVQVADLRRFLLTQPEVREIEWDGQTFSPRDSNNKQRAARRQQSAEHTGSRKRKKSTTKAHRNRVDKAAGSSTEAGITAASSSDKSSAAAKSKKTTKKKKQHEPKADDEL